MCSWSDDTCILLAAAHHRRTAVELLMDEIENELKLDPMNPPGETLRRKTQLPVEHVDQALGSMYHSRCTGCIVIVVHAACIGDWVGAADAKGMYTDTRVDGCWWNG